MRKKKSTLFASTIITLVFSFFVIPILLRKCTIKLYKCNHSDLESENWGPEIKKK